eukprot:gene2301-4261_t
MALPVSPHVTPLHLRPPALGRLLVDSLVDNLVGSLADNLVGSLVDNLVGSLADNLVGSLVDNLVGSLVDSLVGSLVDNLVGSLVDQLVGSLVDNLLAHPLAQRWRTLAMVVRRVAALSGAPVFPGEEARSDALCPLGMMPLPGLRIRPRFAAAAETDAAVRELSEAALACALERRFEGLPGGWEPARDAEERARRAARWGDEDPSPPAGAGAAAGAAGGGGACPTVEAALRRFARELGAWREEDGRLLFRARSGVAQGKVTTSELLRE